MRFVGSLILCLLLLCGSALGAGSRLANIVATDWGSLNGTTATGGPGNSGLAAIDTGWTFKAFSTSVPAPPTAYSSATGYIENASGASKYIQPYRTLTTGDPMVGTGLSADLSEIWMDCWVRGEWDGTAITSQTTSTTPIIGSSPFYRAIVYCNGAATYTPQGFALTTQHSVPASTRYPWQLASSTAVVHAGWNKWHHLTVRFYQNATGKIGIYLNGVLVHESTGDTSQTASGANLRFTMPAVTGVKWQFTGPITLWQGPGDATGAAGYQLNPKWEIDNVNASLVTRIYQPWNVQSSATNGSYFVSGGTGTVATDAEYAIAASSPYRHRLVFSGNGNAPTATTIDEFGTMPVNEQGWTHIVVSDVSAPSGTTFKLALYSPGTTTVTSYLQATGGTLVYSEDGTAANAINVCPWTYASRYAIVWHMNVDGRTAVSTFELTTATYTSFSTSKMAYSMRLAARTPGTITIGKAICTATTTASNVEMGYLAIGRRPSFSTADSLTASSYSASPTIRTSTCVARSLPWGEESTNIPGAYWPRQQDGMPRRLIVAPLGTFGLRRRDLTQGVLTGMQHTYGIEVIAIDGGSINDISEIGVNDAAPTNMQLKEHLRFFLQQCAANDVSVWIGTMLPRNLRTITPSAVSGTTTLTITATANGIGAGSRAYLVGFTGGSIDGLYTTATWATNSCTITSASGGGTYNTMGTIYGYSTQESAAITQYNKDIRDLVARYQSKGLFSLSDIEADTVANASLYPNTGAGAASPVTGFWQDFTHPNTDPYNATDALRGAGTVAKRMVNLKVTPPSSVPPRRPWAYRGTN